MTAFRNITATLLALLSGYSYSHAMQKIKHEPKAKKNRARTAHKMGKKRTSNIKTKTLEPSKELLENLQKLLLLQKENKVRSKL